MKALRDAMRREAGRIWREKARAARLGLFLNEETITESILLNLATAFHGRGLSVRLFTKAAEKRNGADWEFLFIQGAETVGLRVQAKRLFPSGAYNSLKPGGHQISTLIKKATNCFPVYVFYNDAPAYPLTVSPFCACSKYRAPSYLGCTLAPAEAIGRVSSNSASALKGMAIPWHCLLCDRTARNRSMPEAIARNVNRRIVSYDDRRCKVIQTPRRFRAHTAGEGVLADAYYEPDWLAEYLSARALAGIALIFSAADST